MAVCDDSESRCDRDGASVNKAKEILVGAEERDRERGSALLISTGVGQASGSCPRGARPRGQHLAAAAPPPATERAIKECMNGTAVETTKHQLARNRAYGGVRGGEV